MVSKRKFFSIVIMMVVLLFLTQFYCEIRQTSMMPMPVCLSEKQTEKRSSNSQKQKERICLYSFRKKACFLSAMFPVLWERR